MAAIQGRGGTQHLDWRIADQFNSRQSGKMNGWSNSIYFDLSLRAGIIRKKSSMTAETKIEDAMCDPQFYGSTTATIKRLETHVSWVFLAGQWAYKIKKAVANSFLDYGTLEKRKFFCEAELAINKRWAPEIYDSVVPIFHSSYGFNLTDGEIVEYAIRMREFPQSALLLKMIEAEELSSAHVEMLGRELAT
ncbi:MAG: hypothetical protein ABL888_03100, partial [Pirellulaceae bacterium]